MGKEVSLDARVAHANQPRFSQETPLSWLNRLKTPLLMPPTKTTVANQLFLARISTVLAPRRRWA